MENNSLNNLPPFYVGQKVVCVDSENTVSIHKMLFNKNQIYTVHSIKKTNCCKLWVINIGIKDDADILICPCGKESKNDNHFRASRFKPLQQQSFPLISLSKVIEEQLIPAN